MVLDVVEGVAVAALAVALVIAARVDLERRIIPNGCCAVVAGSGLVSALARAAGGGGLAPIVRSALGVATVFSVMALAAAASRRLRGRAGVGGGDVKLLSAAGAWVGPVWGLVVVAAACLASLALCGLAWLVRRLRGETGGGSRLGSVAGGLPLGPGIALSMLVVMLLGVR